MKLSSIERNPDTKQLEVVFSFNDNITISIPIIDQETTIGMIKSTAESLDLDPYVFIDQYKEIFNDLIMYSKYRRIMIGKISIEKFPIVDTIHTLICGGVLSMSEIYWFDWYVKKNKLTGDI